MGTTSLERIHEDLAGLKQDVAQIKTWLSEEYAVNDKVDEEVNASRSSKVGMISQDEMRAEFG